MLHQNLFIYFSKNKLKCLHLSQIKVVASLKKFFSLTQIYFKIIFEIFKIQGQFVDYCESRHERIDKSVCTAKIHVFPKMKAKKILLLTNLQGIIRFK